MAAPGNISAGVGADGGLQDAMERLSGDPGLDPSSARNFGELWLTVLCQTMRISPQQGATVLGSQDGLSKAMASGAERGRGKDILSWLQGLLKYRQSLGRLISQDARVEPAIYSCLHPLHSCMFSKDAEVVKQAAMTLLAVAQTLPPQKIFLVVTSAIDPDNPRKPNAMLMGILAGMKTAPDNATRLKISRYLVYMCNLSTENLSTLLRMHLLQAARSTPLGISLLHYILMEMANVDPGLRNALCAQNIVDEFVIDSIKLLEQMYSSPQSRDNASPTFNARREALTSQLMSLGDMYRNFGEGAPVFLNADLQMRFIRIFKRGTRHSDLSVQLAASAVLFDLFETVASKDGHEKQVFGPQLYKALIFLLVESHADAKASAFDGVLREFVAHSLCQCVARLPHIPVDVLAKPLAAQIQLIGCEVYDFALLEVIMNHPRLSPNCAQVLVAMLGRYALGHPVYWRVAARLLAVATRRFQADVVDALQAIVKGAIKLLPPQNVAEVAGPGEAQRWVCICCLRAVVEMSKTDLRSKLSPLLQTVPESSTTPHIRDLQTLVNTPNELLPDLRLDDMVDGNVLSIEPAFGSTEGWQVSDVELSPTVTATGAPSPDVSNSKPNFSDPNLNSLAAGRQQKPEKQNLGEGILAGTSEIPPPSPRNSYRGPRVIKASNLSELRRENDAARSDRSGGSKRSRRSGRSVGSKRGSGSKSSTPQNEARGENSLISTSSSPSRKQDGGRKRGNPQKMQKGRGKAFVETTLGCTVQEDIARIREARLAKEKQKALAEERRRLRSAKIRKSMRRKFAHIKAVERPNSPLKPGEIRITRRVHKENREVTRKETYETASRLVQKWDVPLHAVFDEFTGKSKGFVRMLTRNEDMDDLSLDWTTMQSNEFLWCLRDLGVIPTMVAKQEAQHRFHCICSGEECSADTVDYELFRACILTLTRLRGVMCQELVTDEERVDAFCSWLRQRGCRVETMYALFNPDNQNVQLGVKAYPTRIRGVEEWEDGSCPEYDYCYLTRPQLRADNMIGAAISDVLEIIDDLLGSIFGWAGRFMCLTKCVDKRPMHARLSEKSANAIIDATLEELQLPTDRADVDWREILAMHVRRTLNMQGRLCPRNSTFDLIMERADARQVKAAEKGKAFVVEKKLVPIIPQATQMAIKRLYKPAEPPATVRMAVKVGFGSGLTTIPPSDESRGVYIPPKPMYRFGQSTLDRLHVRYVMPARAIIGALSDIIDYIISGKARKVLGVIYGPEYGQKGGPLAGTHEEWKKIKPKAKRIGPNRFKYPKTAPVLHPKEAEKVEHVKKREEQKWIKLQHKRDRERKKRRAELGKLLERQKKEKKEREQKEWEKNAPKRKEKEEKQKKMSLQKEKRKQKQKEMILEHKQRQQMKKVTDEAQRSENEEKEKKELYRRSKEAKKRQDQKAAARRKQAEDQAAELGLTVKHFKKNRRGTMTAKIRGEIAKAHQEKVRRDESRKESEEYARRREMTQAAVDARMAIEAQLKRQLEDGLQSETMQPFEYVRASHLQLSSAIFAMRMFLSIAPPHVLIICLLTKQLLHIYHISTLDLFALIFTSANWTFENSPGHRAGTLTSARSSSSGSFRAA